MKYLDKTVCGTQIIHLLSEQLTVHHQYISGRSLTLTHPIPTSFLQRDPWGFGKKIVFEGKLKSSGKRTIWQEKQRYSRIHF